MHAHLRSRGRRWSVAKTSHRVSSADGMSKRILRLIIAQSGFYSAALQLGNVSIVLPFVVAELDAELWIAALIFPAFTAGGAIGNVVAPPAVAAVPRRHRLFIIVSCLAVLAGVNALCATIGKGSVAGILLVVNVTLIGVVSAISFVAFADLVAAMPSGTARARILLTEVGVGAALTAVVAATLSFVPDQHPLSRNIHLLWTAAVAMAISAAICRALPHRIVPRVHAAPGLHKLVYVGWTAIRTNGWYRRYLLVQVLFGSVVLGSSFHSIRVAAVPGDSPTRSLPSSFSSASDSWVGSRCGTASGRDLAWSVCLSAVHSLASPRQCYPSHSIWPERGPTSSPSVW